LGWHCGGMRVFSPARSPEYGLAQVRWYSLDVMKEKGVMFSLCE
jgi:hypothetical protein